MYTEQEKIFGTDKPNPKGHPNTYKGTRSQVRFVRSQNVPVKKKNLC